MRQTIKNARRPLTAVKQASQMSMSIGFDKLITIDEGDDTVSQTKSASVIQRSD
jgi:hypothetical protein